jgi:acetoacetyl-CoA synthetase
MRPIWEPDTARIASSRLTAFMRAAERAGGPPAGDFETLHTWSIERPADFWHTAWSFSGLVGDPGSRVVAGGDRMPGASFFPDGRLNFAENLLRRRDDEPALIAFTETGGPRLISYHDLRADVARATAALRADGVRPGDRVVAIAANVPETVVAALSVAALGATWSSCSPDFGVEGILDRFGQVDPVVIFGVSAYVYGGKAFDGGAKLHEVARRLPRVRRVVSMPPADGAPRMVPEGAVSWSGWLESVAADQRAPSGLDFDPFPFAHPLYILYSSGTTGAPKCIVHGAGGTLIQHLKEHQLHCDIRRGDRVFYFTTCGWMMWNWLVSALASEATVVLYDGSPFHPSGARLFDVADQAQVTLFGTSAKFIDAVRKAGLRPRDTHALESIRTITSTGSPLVAESFDFVYEAIKTDVHLASISGGTDIVSCFVGGNPNAPVWRGEIQTAGLGMDVAVFNERGQPVTGMAGELVCRRPFPSMPVGFWNDQNGEKYRASYFERFPGVWCHGDWMERTPHGGFIIYGRSDTTLNPGGVRIGTAEIYRQVEQIPDIVESLAVGQQWEGDERIVLFVRLSPGRTLDAALRAEIAARIRRNTSPRHVPARIVHVTDIPRTRSGKIVELAVRQMIHGRPVINRDALSNPEALDLYRDLPELRD